MSSEIQSSTQASTGSEEVVVTRECPFCGKTIPADVVFCPFCGKRLREARRIVERIIVEKVPDRTASLSYACIMAETFAAAGIGLGVVLVTILILIMTGVLPTPKLLPALQKYSTVTLLAIAACVLIVVGVAYASAATLLWDFKRSGGVIAVTVSFIVMILRILWVVVASMYVSLVATIPLAILVEILALTEVIAVVKCWNRLA